MICLSVLVYVFFVLAGGQANDLGFRSKYSANFVTTAKPESSELQLILKEMGYYETFRKTVAHSSVFLIITHPEKQSSWKWRISYIIYGDDEGYPIYEASSTFHENQTFVPDPIRLTPNSAGFNNQPLLQRNVTITFTKESMTAKLHYQTGTKCTIQLIVSDKEKMTMKFSCNGKTAVMPFKIEGSNLLWANHNQ